MDQKLSNDVLAEISAKKFWITLTFSQIQLVEIPPLIRTHLENN